MNSPQSISKAVYGALRGIAGGQREQGCELCGAALAGAHAHLLRLSNREVLCACEPCAVLFSHRGDGKRFFRIPRDVKRIEGFILSDSDWSALRLPIELAFFVNNSSEGRVMAYYPSPAGCTESMLDLNAWEQLALKNPELEHMQPDVECLLINRTRGRRDYFTAPIDQCYRLTGLIRRHWRGLSGGDEVWREIEKFFEALRESATCLTEIVHA